MIVTKRRLALGSDDEGRPAWKALASRSITLSEYLMFTQAAVICWGISRCVPHCNSRGQCGSCLKSNVLYSNNLQDAQTPSCLLIELGTEK